LSPLKHGIFVSSKPVEAASRVESRRWGAFEKWPRLGRGGRAALLLRQTLPAPSLPSFPFFGVSFSAFRSASSTACAKKKIPPMSNSQLVIVVTVLVVIT